MNLPKSKKEAEEEISLLENELLKNKKLLEEIEIKKKIKKPSTEENLNAEDKILLEELRAKSSSITKKTDLQYFIDKAGEDPVAFAETFGEEILNKLITRIPTSKLEKNYLNLKQLPGTKISSMALKNFIEERKDKNENLEAGKDDLIQTLIKEFDGEYLKINGLKSKLYDTNKTEEELEEIKNEILALTEGQKQRIESLVKNGASEDILRDRREAIEGVNKELKMINEEKNKGQNELSKKKNELFKQFMESIKERKILEKRLAEIDKILNEQVEK